MGKISPCKDCPDRYPGCHDSCEKYKCWKDELAAVKKDLRLKNSSHLYNYAAKQRVWRSYRRDNSHAYKKFSC